MRDAEPLLGIGLSRRRKQQERQSQAVVVWGESKGSKDVTKSWEKRRDKRQRLVEKFSLYLFISIDEHNVPNPETCRIWKVVRHSRQEPFIEVHL